MMQRPSRILLLVVLTVASAARAGGQNDERPGELLLKIDAACEAIGEDLAGAAQTQWPCSALTDDAAVTACRQKLVAAATEPISEELDERARSQQADLFAAWAETAKPDQISLLSPLGGDFADLIEETVETLEARAAERLAKIDLKAAEGQAAVRKVWSELADEAGDDFEQRCRRRLLPDAFRAAAIEALRSGAEEEHVRSLTKTSGFSQLVRCHWKTTEATSHLLECTPGLRISGEDASGIIIEAAPGEDALELAWVKATTAEEGTGSPLPGKSLRCPGSVGTYTDPRKLTCDEICFARTRDDGTCGNAPVSSSPAQKVSIAVHKPRWFFPSYGCWSGFRKCALRRLRGLGRDEAPQREKLSLVLDGKSPYILVHAMDSDGRLASGTILVGYERWRVETGGFMAFSPLVDEELVRVPVTDGSAVIDGTTVEVGEQQVAIERTREADDWTQETGIFTNFVPTNYESIGVGFGIATHDGGAPSIYLGPVLRFRSFGHRGLGAIAGGVVMREVDRFPDFEPGVYDADSSFLEPDSRLDHDWFVGIQFGFSFGSISVPGDNGNGSGNGGGGGD